MTNQRSQHPAQHLWRHPREPPSCPGPTDRPLGGTKGDAKACKPRQAQSTQASSSSRPRPRLDEGTGDPSRAWLPAGHPRATPAARRSPRLPEEKDTAGRLLSSESTAIHNLRPNLRGPRSPRFPLITTASSKPPRVRQQTLFLLSSYLLSY